MVSNSKPPSQLKPYVSIGKKLNIDQERAVFSKFHSSGGVTPTHFLRVAREHTFAKQNPASPAPKMDRMPAWISAQIRLGLMEDPRKVPVVVEASEGRFQNFGKRLGIGRKAEETKGQPTKKVKELKVVSPTSPSS